jgi:hypothetical protein
MMMVCESDDQMRRRILQSFKKIEKIIKCNVFVTMPNPIVHRLAIDGWKCEAKLDKI